jgi:hypothetical protein
MSNGNKVTTENLSMCMWRTVSESRIREDFKSACYPVTSLHSSQGSRAACTAHATGAQAQPAPQAEAPEPSQDDGKNVKKVENVS